MSFILTNQTELLYFGYLQKIDILCSSGNAIGLDVLPNLSRAKLTCTLFKSDSRIII